MAEFEDILNELKAMDTDTSQSDHGEESTLGAGVRHTARTGTEVLSRLAGGLGDLGQAGVWLMNQPEKVGRWAFNKAGLGGLLPEYEENFRLPIPTSEDIKSGIKGTVGKILPKNYLEATTSGERLSDDFFGDVASLMLPIPKVGGLGMKKALAISGLSNMAGWGARELGGGEGVQTGAKIGTIALTALAGAPWIRKHMNAVYDVAHDAITPGASVSVKKMEPLLNEIDSLASKGAKTKTKQFMKDRVKEIRDKMHVRYVWNPETESYTQQAKEGKAGELSFGKKVYRMPDQPNMIEEMGPVINTGKEPGFELRTRDMFRHEPYVRKNELTLYKKPGSPEEYIHKPTGREFESEIKEKTPLMNFLPENHIPVEEAWEFKKDMNEFLQDLDTPYKAKGNIKRLTGAFRGLLQDYGKENPRFWEALSEADNIFAGLHEASAINSFLQKHINEKNLSKMTAGILLGWHSPFMAAKYATGALAARGAVQSFEALKNSSAIRNYYWKVMSSAAKKDSKGVIKNIAALDREIKKEYSEEGMSMEELDKILANI